MDISSLFHKKLLFISGKGGVGKSAMAVSLALAASRQKKKVLLVEQTITDVLPSFFKNIAPRLAGSAYQEECFLTDDIRYLRISGQLSFRDYVVKHLGMPSLYEKVFTNRKVQSFLAAIPGLAETMMLGRLFYSCELAGQRPDLVIYDAPASGHFLSFLTTPDSLLRSGLVGPLMKEVERVRDFLKSGVCAIVWVTLPEELVTGETLDFLPQLRERSPVKDIYLLMNRSRSASKDLSTDFLSFTPSDSRADSAISFARNALTSAQYWESKLLAELERSGLCKDVFLFPDLGSSLGSANQEI
ncbi:MAG: P-loop NTPase [Oligoflexales bacterium]|nr:P-loop NTPase [Oligoflexales bacterium]